MRSEKSYIEGRRSVLEAIRANTPIERIYVLEGNFDGPIQTIVRDAKKNSIPVEFVDKKRLDNMSESKKHQGVLAYTAAFEYKDIEDMLALAKSKNEPPFLILLDEIEDPHNLGAIIRSANLSGAHGIITTKHRSCGLTATVAKASCGALSYTPVARVTNLKQTMNELKEKGMWFVCADIGGPNMYDVDMTGPIGLVIGNEGSGVSTSVKKNCDMIASIPMKGDIESLNASVACGILSYEVLRQREFR